MHDTRKQSNPIMSAVTLSILPTIHINGTAYHNSKDMLTLNPVFFKGFTTTPRRIIERKKIPAIDYLYATMEKGNGWNLSTNECKKAQLLISANWINMNRFFGAPSVAINEVVSASAENKVVSEVVNEVVSASAENEVVVSEVMSEAMEEPEVSVKNAPPILHLSDAEKFHDVDGRVIDIETRGERDRKKIYFKVKDVSIGFEMPSLDKNIMFKERGFERGIHYTTFKRESMVHNVNSNSTNKPCKTTLYLTYKGLLRVLFVSRNKHVDKFQDWAEEKLFTIQLGSKEQKVKLGTDLCNIPLKTYQAIFESHTSNFPSIYLVSLGKVRDVRATFEISDTISDDSVVYKFGFTKDFARRIGEHNLKYSKLHGVTVDVKWFQNIDIKYLKEAEAEVKEECSAYGTRIYPPGHIELIVLNDKQFDHMQKSYRRIGKEYAGATAELNETIALLRTEIKDMHMQHKHDLLEKDMVIQRLTMQNEMSSLKEDNLKLQLKFYQK